MNDIQRMIEENFSLKGFMLMALLFLPLAFTAWMYFGWIIIGPAGMLSDWVLTGFWPETFSGVVYEGAELGVLVRMMLPDESQVPVVMRMAEVTIQFNPLIYGYGLPLLAGLTLATPIAPWKKALQIVAGFVVVSLIMAWGVVFELFKDLMKYRGEAGLQIVSESGLSTELISFCYQFGYLVFPGVIPAILWVIMNRTFIEYLVQGRFSPAVNK